MASLAVMLDLVNTPTDPRPAFFALAEVLANVADQLSAEDFARPTPCSEFDVRALLGHIVGVLQRCSAVSRGQDPMEVMAEGFLARSDQWGAAIRSVLGDCRAGWADAARLDDRVVFPWATHTGAGSIRMWTCDLVVHGWDLTRATQLAFGVEASTVEQALETSLAQLPMADRAPMWGAFATQLGADPANFSGPFANAVPVSDDATILDRVVAWNGRDPHWSVR